MPRGSILRRSVPSAICFAALLLAGFGAGSASGQVVTANLALTMSDSPDPVEVGEPIDYTLTVHNAGPQEAANVSVVNVLGSFTVSSLPPQCSQAGGQVNCDFGSVAVGASEALTIALIAHQAGQVTNAATVSSTIAFDPNTGNNTDSETTTVSATELHSLEVRLQGGSGTVTSSPAGIGCGSDCSHRYADGTQVTLTATPAASFVGWTEACAAALGNTCTLTMDAAKTALAEFAADPAEPPTAAFAPTPTSPARGLVGLDASATTGATRIRWAISGNGGGAGALSQFETSPASPFTALRIAKSGIYDVEMTAVGPGGSTTTSQTITVPETNRKLMDPRLPNALYSGPSALALSAVEVREEWCVVESQVVFGTVDARGCFNHVLAASDIPAPERPVAGEWFDSQLKGNGCGGGFFQLGLGQCFTPAEYLGVVYSTQPVRFNGMTLTPQNGAAVVLFPASGKVISSNATLTLNGAPLGTITAHSGPLNLFVGAGDYGNRLRTSLFSFNAQKLPSIGGFRIDGQMSVSLVKDGARRFTDLAVSMTLPTAFSTSANTRPTGSVSIAADNDRGLILNELFLSVPEAFLGGVRLANLSFTYKDAGEASASPPCARKWWKATAEIFILPAGGKSGAGLSLAPPPTRNGVAFCAGGFHSAGGQFTFGHPIPPPQIFPGVFLDSIGFNMALDPTVLSGDASVTAGGIVRATGGLLVAFASPGAPYVVQAEDGGSTLGGLAGTRLTSTSFALGGSIGMALPQNNTLGLANGYFLYEYPNYIKAAGFARVNTFLFLIEADAGFEMNLATRRFNASVNGNVCLAGGISIKGRRGCIGGYAHVSHGGMVACLIIIDDAFEPGIGYHWGDALPHIYNGITDGCKPSHYWAQNIRSARLAAAGTTGAPPDARPVDRAAAPLAFTVKPGDKAKDIELHGEGAAPAVEVRAPDGETITTVPNEMQIGTRLQALAWEEYDYTWIGVANGEPGTYVVTPLEGSAPITEIFETRSTSDRGIKASVTGKGRKRVLRYDVGQNPGQRVTFVERGDGVREQLGVAKRGKGEIRFEPAPGAAGPREIVAEYEVDGIPAADEVLDTYTAPPPPQAGRVKGVRVTRRGSSVLVSWRKAPEAVGYGVVVRRRDGELRSIDVGARRQRARIGQVPRTEAGTVTVTAFGPLGDRGRRGADRFKATKKKADRRHPYGELGSGGPAATAQPRL